MEWVSLSITHVEYPLGDFFGKILAIMSMCPLAIITGLVTLILFRRDLHTITFFLGILLNEAVNFVVKHCICEPRPMRRETLYVEYGMPSSHSQFIWFFATYMTLFVLFRLHYTSNGNIHETLWRCLVIGICVVAAILVTFSRVYLMYHTWMQVSVGALFGIIIATAWFICMHFIFSPVFPIVASWPISEFLMVRDTTLIPNILWFEYTNARQESRTRNRKLVSMKSQ